MVAHVRIVSNESIFNLPQQKKKAHGGTAIFARSFSSYVTRNDHEWIGLIERNTKGRKTYLKKACFDESRLFYYIFFPSSRYREIINAKKPLDAKKLLSKEIGRTEKFFKEVRPDIVFLNGFSLTAWIMLMAAKEMRIPAVIQHAGIWQVEMEVHKRVHPPTARKIFLEMERDTARYAALHIFLNEYSQGVFERKVMTIPDGRSTIIPLPYQAEMLQHIRHHRISGAKQKPNIGNVARWDLIKDYTAYLNVAKAAHADGLPWEFHSVMIIPDTRFKRRLKAQYRKHIQVLAPMGRKELARFYSQMDMLILPSKFDVSPNVVMEAVLAGKPTLISPSVGWVSEYKACGMDDWIIDFKDPKKVVARMKKLSGKPRPKRFRTYILKKHSPKSVFKKYLESFEQVQAI
ncbi:glycosyltransferase family 4 protein [Candidatus Uhrbacteria bacterium]|nr:glycosyltransferase family 4 protein [Candidatus Uhrbacteria bacterium]